MDSQQAAVKPEAASGEINTTSISHVQLLALSKRGISSLSGFPITLGDGWQPHQWQLLSTFKQLRSLWCYAPDLSPLAQLTQLQHLMLGLPQTKRAKHAEALTHLTALTHLDLATYYHPDFLVHENIAEAVGSLSSLRHLELPCIPGGIWTDTLAGMTQLTQLSVPSQSQLRQQPPHRIHLPSVEILSIESIIPRQLAQISAPALQRLEVYHREELQLSDMPSRQ
jgi:hypothetical protein